MKKFTTFITLLLLCAISVFAQAPEKFTYQAVVRNASNSLVSNTQVGVRVSLLQGSATGNAIYVETQSTTTNTNGLLSVEIGGGTVQQGTFANIDWANGPYFLKTEIDPNGGTNYSITSTQQLLSVPYALYAKESGNAFSGDYNDLTNTPTIPSVPTNVSAFTNDAGYLTTYTETDPQYNAWDKDYNDLINKPVIPTVPNNVSAFTNDAGYITGYTETDPQYNAWDKDYNDLINKPVIPVVPTNVSDFNNDAGYITTQDLPTIPTVPTNVSAFNNDAGYITSYTETDPQYNAWDKDYNDLINKPVIPVVPTNVSDFNNDAGYITTQDLPTIPTVPTNVSAFNNDAGYITGYTETDPQYNAWDKDYNDLINKPVIPTVPTNVSAFVNDVPYLTTFTEQQILTISNDTIFLTGGSFVKLPAGFSGDYNDLTNKPEIPEIPEIPEVPENVSAFANDANYVSNTACADVDLCALATALSQLQALVQEQQQRIEDLEAAIGTTDTTTIPVDTTTTFTNPTVSTDSATNTTETSATLNGSITNPDNVTITAQGFEWKAADGGTYTQIIVSGDALTYNLTGLSANTTYIYKAFITYEGTTVYGEEVTFTTLAASTPVGGQPCSGTPTVTDYDGNVYNTVKIGAQCWMKENLRTTHYADGTSIPAGSSTSSTSPYYYDYSTSSLSLQERGYLYNWPAVMNGATSSSSNPSNVKGICPIGWHVPSDEEWTELMDTVRSHSDWVCGSNNITKIAKALASATGWDNSSTICDIGNNQSTNNGTGFGAFPAGIYGNNVYSYSGSITAFWSATENGTYSAWSRYLLNASSGVGRDGYHKNSGYSVRCLRNESSTTFTNPTVSTDSATNVTETSATLNGSITNPDNVTITAQGFEWKAADGGTYTHVAADGTSMTYTLTGLTANTSYIYKAFITYDGTTVYGEEVTFTTLAASTPVNGQPCPSTPTVSDHEGNVYNTVQIGNQCWTKENLRTCTSPTTGTYLIPASGTGYTCTGKQARWYNDDSATYASMNYGLLYNWNAAVDTFNTAYGETSVNADSNNLVLVNFIGHRRGICPVGWHLPSDAEWTAMVSYVSSQSEYVCSGDSSYIAKALADSVGWNSDTSTDDTCVVGNNQSTNNATGFSAVPAGYSNGSWFSASGYYTYFWSSSQYEHYPNYAWYQNYAWSRHLGYSSANVNWNIILSKAHEISVRCLRDESSTTFTNPTVSTDSATNVTETSATLNGTITNPDNVNITAQGFEWKAADGGTYTQVAANGTSMTYTLTGLTANTSYIYKAFITYEGTTVYGEEVTFMTQAASTPIGGQPCPGFPTMTDADGNVYPTVQIGNQCWTKENLRTTQNNVGEIPLYTNSAVSQSSSLTSSVNPYRFAPHNDLSKVETYGYLYNWPAILGKNGPVNDNSTYCQGICPDGWHVPSSSDWQELMTYISNQPQYSCENNPVCTKNSLYDSIFVTNGINTSPNVNSTGFSLRASGYYFSCFMYQSGFVGQWTSSYGCWSDPCTMEGENYNYQFKSSHMPAYECMAVRCLKTPDEKIFSGAVTIGNYFFTDDTLVVEITDIVADGSPVTEVGACWSGGGPCINLFNAQTVSYDPSHSGPIYIKLSGVDTTGIIYFKAFINLEAGTIYSNLVSASTTYTFSPHACSSSPIVTDIDGNIYNTVQIGNQCWMRENLRTTHFADGSAIVGGGSLSYTTPYYYDNASSSIPLTDRGYYYNWTAVMHGASSSSANPSGVQGICPTGWHVPSDAEWSQLTNYMSSIPYYLCNSNDSSTFAKALSSKSYWAGNENACSIGYDLSTNNDSGFSAVPAGRRMSWVMYEGEHSTFSSCTEGTSDEEFWALDFNTYHPRVSRYPMSKDRGYSVRCLRD